MFALGFAAFLLVRRVVSDGCVDRSHFWAIFGSAGRLPPRAGIAFSMQEDDPKPAEPHRWRIYVAAVAVLYLIFTWAAWHAAITWGGHTITYTTMIICAAGCVAAAGEALPRAAWP